MKIFNIKIDKKNYFHFTRTYFIVLAYWIWLELLFLKIILYYELFLLKKVQSMSFCIVVIIDVFYIRAGVNKAYLFTTILKTSVKGFI